MLLMLFQSGESKTVYCVSLHMFVLCFWFFPLIPLLQLGWAGIAIFVIHPQQVFLVVIYENHYPLS